MGNMSLLPPEANVHLAAPDIHVVPDYRVLTDASSDDEHFLLALGKFQCRQNVDTIATMFTFLQTT